MAEVKQASGSFSLSMKKKPPSFNSNGVSSSSFKHIYDDVFASPLPSKPKSSTLFMDDDYAEIFGSSKSNNGSWNISYSSVPILELQREQGIASRGGGGVDYGGVFGGVESSSFGLPDGEELFDQLKKKAKTSSANNLPRSQVQTTEATSPETSSQSYKGKSPTYGFDNMKQAEEGNTKVTVDANGRPRIAAHVRAYSLHEVSDTQNSLSSQTPVVRDDMLVTESKSGKKRGKHARHTSLELDANKQDSYGDAGCQNVSGTSGSNLFDTSHNSFQPGKAGKTGFSQSIDNTKHTEHKIDEVGIERTNREQTIPDVNRIHESDLSSHDFGPSQENMCLKTPVLNETTRADMVDDLPKEQKKHSRNASLDNGKSDAVFQKACGLSESTLVDASHQTCEVNSVAGPSYAVKDDVDISIGHHQVKKGGRRTRMTSVDLGDYKHSGEPDDGPKRKPRLRDSYSFDASHDPCPARVKVQPSKMYPSSSLPQFYSVESHYKISKNSSCRSSQKNLYERARDSPPSFAEELDVNSAAAVSVAALQRAIEEAEMRIRWAKAFLERQGQGSSNMRFKDTLKVKVPKESGPVNEINKLKQSKEHEYLPPSVSELQPCSPLQKRDVVETAQGAPVSEDQKMFVKDGKLTEDDKVANNIKEDDKREGGEWEAAKHLNQLFSGVKNKLASFMSWQTETEKKEDPKEMEATMKRQQHPEEVECDIIDHEVYKKKRTEQNQGTSMSADEAMYGGNKMQLPSEAVVPEENKLNKSFDVKQDKAGNEVNSHPDTTVTSSATFEFFAFRNQRFCDLSYPEVEEKKGPQESSESEFVNGQEPVINEVKLQQILCQGEEVVQEKSDDNCVTGDSKRLENTYRTDDIGFSEEENDKTVEEPCSLDTHDKKVLSHEEDRPSDLIRKGGMCFMNGDNVEMMEENHPMAVHDNKELTNEEDGHNDTIKMSYLGSINVENDDIVEQPYSLDGHEEKGLTHEDDGEDDLYGNNSHLGSSNEENEENVTELSTQVVDEKNDVVHVDDNIISHTEELGEELIDHDDNASKRTDKNGECELPKEAQSQLENVEIVEEINLVGETWKNIELTDGVSQSPVIEKVQIDFKHIEAVSGHTYGLEEIDRVHRETNHSEEVSGVAFGWEEVERIQNQIVHLEETSENVTVQASSTDKGCLQNQNVILNKGNEACRIVECSSEVEEAEYSDAKSENMMDITNTPEPDMDIRTVSAQKASEFGEEPLVSAQKASEWIRDEPSVSTQHASELIGEEPPVLAPKESKLIGEESVLSSISTEHTMELHRNGIKEGINGTVGTFQRENTVSIDSEIDMSSGQKDVDVQAVEPGSEEILESRMAYLHDSGENLHAGEFDTASDQDAERSSVEAIHRRRRWFDNGGSIATAERPSILKGNKIDSEVDQEVLDESEFAGSVEIHTGKLNCSASEVRTAKSSEASLNQDGGKSNVESTPTRRRWFVQKEGVPEPLSLFEDIKVNLKFPLESMNESLLHNISGNCLDELNTKSGESLNAVKSDLEINGDKGKQSGEAAPRRKRWFESAEKGGSGQQAKPNKDFGLSADIDQKSKAKVDAEKLEKHDSMPIPQVKDDVHNKVEPRKELHTDVDEVNRRGKEKEKEKIAVERAIREARERAFADARERARRDAAGRPHVEARIRVAAGAQEKLGKVSSEATSFSDKIAMEAKLKAERAAVERATAEARERALQKALSEKDSQKIREQGGRYSSEKNSSLDPKHHSSKCSESSNNSENFDGANIESAQRRKARLDRQTRTMERAAKALEEKNRRDFLVQKEQAAKNMMADSLDAEVKRWSSGKEGNLRALLSTLQYVLGSDSGWQPVSLTDLVAATGVRKAYKKATLCVHPDKLQQRGATIQQKYICEKVFDLLKDAWSKFNPDER